MKRLLLVSAMVVLTLMMPIQASDTLTVLHLNDTHSHLLPYGPKDGTGAPMWGGMARLATLVGMNRMTEPNVMLLHSGDFFVGDFMFQKYVGVPELEIMKALGVDALELGNHEFDLYSSTLKYVLTTAGFPGAGFPILCANLDYTADPEMGYFIQPYTIKQVGGVKVGLFGLNTEFTNSGSNVAPCVIQPPLAVAQAWIDTLRIGHECDIVILMSHLGTDLDKAVAASTVGIDVIVGGHTHTTIMEPITIGGTLIVQAGEHARYLGKLQMIIDGGELSSWAYDLQSVDQTVPAEPTIAGMLQFLAAGVEADPRFGPVFSQPVATAAIEIDRLFGKGLVMDNPMGNMVSDALREATGTDIAFQPQGFINQQIWAGPVTGAEIFQSVPYGFDETSGLGFKLATFTTSGMSVLAGLEFSVYNLPYLEDFFLHGSNVSFAYDGSAAPGSRLDYASVLINGEPIDLYGSYTVTVPEGVVPLLTQIPGFSVTDVNITGTFMYTAVRDFMTSHSPVAYYREGNIFDLAALASPAAASTELGDLVASLYDAGAIADQQAVHQLELKYDLAARSLERNLTMPAKALLSVADKMLNRLMQEERIAADAALRLKYATGKLMDKLETMLAVRKDGGGVLTAEDLPTTYAIEQNYPNPFNPSTNISYQLPVNGHVTIAVYNILGQEIRRLVDESQVAGNHTVTWDATDNSGATVATGVYLYRIEAGDYSASRSMLLIK